MQFVKYLICKDATIKQNNFLTYKKLYGNCFLSSIWNRKKKWKSPKYKLEFFYLGWCYPIFSFFVPMTTSWIAMRTIFPVAISVRASLWCWATSIVRPFGSVRQWFTAWRAFITGRKKKREKWEWKLKTVTYGFRHRV